MRPALNLDWESRSEIDLIKSGFDLYSGHPSTEIISAAWSWDSGVTVHRWDIRESEHPPREIREAYEDPEVIKWAFNAAFERVMAKRVLGWKVPYKNFRCTMALANMMGFTGTLDQIGVQTGLPDKYMKDKEGNRLIKLFCGPQKITKSNPHVWRDWRTDPEDWEHFVGIYNPKDVISECALLRRLIKFPILESEWELYELDQRINERGFPIDRQFVDQALIMADRRKNELKAEMQDLTGLKNPNSGPQFIPWLKERGYPFDDLRKDTVKKVLTENEECEVLDADAVQALKLRQWAARTSTRKLNALQKALADDNRFRFGFQFSGAARTRRFSGRRFQPHNLARPAKNIEPDKKLGELIGAAADFFLAEATQLIKDGDYDALALMFKEPMEALVSTIRSCIATRPGKRLTVADLASIETRVTAWVSDCLRLLHVINTGLDPYIDFATFMFNKKYEEVTKRERQEAKPPVLGCTYRLGGGHLKDGKRTGLWGYAESMGVNITKEASHRAVTVFRQTYVEVVRSWYALEEAIITTIRTGGSTTPNFRVGSRHVKMPIRIHYRKPFLMIELPSGSYLYYHLPRVERKTMYGYDGEPYEKDNISYMGQNQVTKKWGRVDSHGGKFFENIVQAIARDVLKEGMLRVHKAGFNIILHVHDEIATETKHGDNYYTYHLLEELMSQEIEWCPGLPLAAEGYEATFYRK